MFVPMSDQLTMKLHKIGQLNITLINKNESSYIINLKAIDGQYRQIAFCLGWSLNYLYADSKYVEINIPKMYNDLTYDRCFHTLHSLDYDEDMNITINYKTFLELTPDDKIEMVFFDSNRDYTNKYIIETNDGKDVGGENYLFTIPNK